VPKPQRRDATWYGLFVPILVYGIGLFLYSFLAFVPMKIDGATVRQIGSGMMVFGGVFGNIASLSEIYGKIASNKACLRDRAEAAVALSANVLTLFVTYAKFGDAPATWWIAWTQAHGTGLLLITSAFDAAVDLSQFGGLVHSFDARLTEWYEARKTAEEEWQNRIVELRKASAKFQRELRRADLEIEGAEAERRARMQALRNAPLTQREAQRTAPEREAQRDANATQPMKAHRKAQRDATALSDDLEAQNALDKMIEERDIPERIADVLRVFLMHPEASFALAAEIMGCAPSTAARRWSDAVELGLGEERDGKRIVLIEKGGER
jgi:hypothetical protein